MNTATNLRLITVLLVLLVVLLALIVIGIIGAFLMMGAGMMGTNGMMNGRMVNDMSAACAEMMKNIH